MVKIILTPEQITEIQFARNLVPIKDISAQYHIGYGRIYEIWKALDPESIRPKVSMTVITSLKQENETLKTKNEKLKNEISNLAMPEEKIWKLLSNNKFLREFLDEAIAKNKGISPNEKIHKERILVDEKTIKDLKKQVKDLKKKPDPAARRVVSEVISRPK